MKKRKLGIRAKFFLELGAIIAACFIGISFVNSQLLEKVYMWNVERNLTSIAKETENAGINYLAVSSLEEALEVRKINDEIPVLILEPISLEATKVATENNITITVDNTQYFDALIESNIKAKFHLKIDSGMNRFGIKEKKQVNYILQKRTEALYLEGIYTHLSNGRTNNEIYVNQINSFKYLTSDIDLSKKDIVHLDRALTMEKHEKLEFANGVRLGIAMY